MTSSKSYLKWSPANCQDKREVSYMKNKHHEIGNNVMETILKEGLEFVNAPSKRENNFTKMNEREMIPQKNLNPFITTNYLEDLKIQEDFLTPQNSNLKLNSNQ